MKKKKKKKSFEDEIKPPDLSKAPGTRPLEIAEVFIPPLTIQNQLFPRELAECNAPGTRQHPKPNPKPNPFSL